MPNRYDWKRFWCPRDGRLGLSDDGYLSDPDGPHGSLLNPDVLSFEALANIRCLVLLGEPGIGKSIESEKQFEITQGQVETDGNEALFFNLRDFDSGILLRDEIFKSPLFLSWLSQSNQLYLYLDSMDEGLLSVNTLATLLASQLRKCPVDRLLLRIVCRTAEWPEILTAGLKNLWGDEQVKLVELAPLRRKDVYQAAETFGLDPDAFLEAVSQRDVVPLVTRPLTLDFLLKTFRNDQQVPATKAELYAAGCLLLCEEQNESRLASGCRPSLSSGQLLAAASRIAAVTTFCNRSAIWKGTPIADAPDGDATLNEMAGGTEKADGNSFVIGEEEIRQTLATGLFTARGPHRMGWAHQTFAEYLAARYLKDQDLPIARKMDLIVSQGDQEGKLVPQLYETASWLAGMDTEVFRRVVDADPQVLLRSDIATADLADRARLVENLLRLFDEEKLLDFDLSFRTRYHHLSHPRLADQLRPYITDRTKNAMSRRVAIDIAEACKVSALQNDLVVVALDETEVIEARVNAAYAIAEVGDKEAREALMPLARGEAGSDPNDELKGCGLRAVWPDSLCPQDMFSLLTVPRRQFLLGAYSGFLSRDLVQCLSPEDLPLALEWVRERAAGHDKHSQFGRLASEIMIKAWENLDVSGVAAALAKTIISRLQYSDDDLAEVASKNDDKRRQLLGIIIPELKAVNDKIIWLAHSKAPLAQSEDLQWLIERLRGESSPEVKKCLVELIHAVFNFRQPGHLDAIIEAAKTESLIGEKFSWHLTPVDLNSPEAKRQQELSRKYREMEHPPQKKAYEGPSPTEQIPILLDRFEAGDVDAWWRLNIWMAADPETGRFDDCDSDIIKMQGWKAADDLIRSRIIQGALQYLLNAEPKTDEWLGKDVVYRPAFAGYRAIFLLFRLQPNVITTLSPEIWQKWAPIILAYPIEHSRDRDKDESHSSLVGMAYQKVKKPMLDALITLIDGENARSSHLFVLGRVENCWDDDLAGILLAKVKDPQLKTTVMGQILGALIDFGSDGARKYAELLITTRQQQTEREKAKIAGRALFGKMVHLSWPVLWQVLEEDPEFGKEVIASAVHGPQYNMVDAVKQLTEEHLADLYIWLVQQYPYEEDPKYDSVYSVGPDDSARRFRDAILRTIKERGNALAVTALRRVEQSLPQHKWLRWSVIEAQNQKRRMTWDPVLPQTLLKLIQELDKRLVQSGEQLLSVLIESLQRLESKLQGETPAAVDLWNQIDKATFRPKDENDFANYVKRHFDDDLKGRGIIVNREVEIRRGVGGAQGERTDIHVDAVLTGGNYNDYDTFTVIIEAKGCWHAELMIAMENQLKGRYLNDNQCQHGLYLVGWFNCEQWDRQDSRYSSRVQRLKKFDLEQSLESQAVSLSDDEVLLRSFVINAALRPVR